MFEQTKRGIRFIRNKWIKRNFKDELFRRAFASRKDLLNLYNALNGTEYDNPDELTITTLEDAIYMGRKNDSSFIISSCLNLYEHQSTLNPNMPIRGLLYFSRLYEAYIELNKLDIFSSTLVKLPVPQYVIFYNGEADAPDEQILKLSNAFITANKKLVPDLECTARVLNINEGHNQKLLDTCKRLGDYSIFIGKVKEYSKKMIIADAIDKAIDECISKDILVDILVKQRSEVREMLLFTYDEKLHKKTELKEAHDAGVEQGIEQGLQQGLEQGLQILVTTLHEIYGNDVAKIAEAIRKNELYKNVSDNDIKKYM